MTDERKKLLDQALKQKGYANDVFISDIVIKEIPESEDCHVEVYKWNTSRSWVVELTAKWKVKENRFTVSYHKKGITGNTKDGAPGRQSKPIKI